MNTSDVGSVICPKCSAENYRTRTHCFLCGESLAGATLFVPPKPDEFVVYPRNQPTFRLNSMMLLIALIAVFLGVWHEAPGLAIALTIPGSIALIRTFVRAGRADRPSSPLGHVAVFLVTFLSVIGVAIAAGIAFFVTCLGIVATGSGPYGGDRFGAGMIVGGIVGLATLIGLTTVLVRRSRRSRRKATGLGDLS